jgi:hypothetical protein
MGASLVGRSHCDLPVLIWTSTRYQYIVFEMGRLLREGSSVEEGYAHSSTF